jgi:MYXO-CTERM domain-containing protein
VVLGAAILSARGAAAAPRTFAQGSLIIPMDLVYQDRGLFQAYGLVFQLLRQGVPVYWVIDPAKVWHTAACNTAGDPCSWDCAEEGSGVKCAYPTASPDFYAGAEVVWDGAGAAPGTLIANHGYRGGPFVIDAADAQRARDIIDAWNDQTKWTQNPWAQRTVFRVVTVHQAAESFSGDVRKEMVAAPTIAVFADGNEDIATGYLRAAGIPQSNGHEFPTAKCAGDCGPGSNNPDMMTEEAIMGPLGTCDQPDMDHRNGSLFTAEGIPAYCQIMSMHWDVVNGRDAVKCNGGACPATQAECAGEPITYNGHEVVAEVREFLNYPVHFFAECQAVNAYEDTVPRPEWPWLDDANRDGHFLTTTGTPPDCTTAGAACSDADYACLVDYCDVGTRSCCQSKNAKEQGAGYLIAQQPASNTLKILHPEVPYNQLDGAFATVGGSEPAYNLSAYLDTKYKNDREVVFITGPNGPGDQDVWMTGYIDGNCSIGDPDTPGTGACGTGKVSYLGGHQYATSTPVSQSPQSQGTRLFLNALFEADCVTAVGQPNISLNLMGSAGGPTLPVSGPFTATWGNSGPGPALDSTLHLTLPAGVTATAAGGGGVISDGAVDWDLGTIGGLVAQPGDPASSGSRDVTLEFAAYGDYVVTLRLDYRVGVTPQAAGPLQLTIHVGTEPPAGGDGGAGDGGVGPGGGDSSGCGCRTSGTGAASLALGLLVPLVVMAWWRRRR